jgi:two-component system chemotaxis sensor kinase CheA
MSAEGRPAVWTGGDAIPLSDLPAVLGRPPSGGDGPVVVVATATGRHAFRVGALLGQRDVVVKDITRVLPRLDMLGGASVEPDGSVMLVLDPQGLLHTAAGAPRTAIGAQPPAERALPAAAVRTRVLVVDDALTIRELMETILVRAGYDVVTAGDGMEALERLREAAVDLVVTDLEMPGMDGFALTEAIRATEATRHLPVVVLTSRTTDADRRRGMEAGCDGYLVKRSFDEHALLTEVRRLLDVPGSAGG